MTPLNPPKQPRSERTLERIVNAALEILEAEGPEGVTVQAVVARARSSVGSFYARFRGKDDLLEYLGKRIWDEASGRWQDALAARPWSGMDLAEMTEGVVALLVHVPRSGAGQLRALDRMAGGGDAYETFRRHLRESLETLLLERRQEIVHPNPELAVRLGLTAVEGVIDSGVEAPGQEVMTPALLVGECTGLLLGYLAGPTQGTAGQVDFFEVWA